MKPLPWSHSSLENFKTCPKQFYHKKVLKDVVEVAGEAAEWGNRLHKAFEDNLKNNVPLAKELENYVYYVTMLKQFDGEHHIEKKLGVAEDLSPCDFSSPNVWSRGIIDVLIVKGNKAFILDHKSGKVKPSTQLLLNSLLVFRNFPEVMFCKTVFYWLKTDTVTVGRHERKDEQKLWGSYSKDLTQYKKAFEMDIWIAKQSGLCSGWCPVESCQFWRPRRK